MGIDLQPATLTTDVEGPNPMRPAVRSVVNADRTSTAQAIVAPTIAEYTTPALYSNQARRRRTEGVVTIALRVDEQGNASNVRVVRGLGDGLDQNALVAVRQWRFRAGTSDGQPVAMDAEVDIEFNLRTEAINELMANDMVTLVGPGITPPKVARAIDIYGEVLPNQNGAPLRLVVPWKYGFKGIKSIARIRFAEKQPVSSWQLNWPQAYGFYANVNPAVDHPEWRRATEARLPSLFKTTKTIPFNGYGDQVASLYSSMDLRKNY